MPDMEKRPPVKPPQPAEVGPETASNARRPMDELPKTTAAPTEEEALKTATR